MRTGRPLLATPDVYEDLVRRGEAELIGAPSLDWVGVPLQIRDRTIGVVAVQTYSEGIRYGEEEKDILTFVSTQVAMAIERKRAEDALRAQRTLLQSIVDHIPVMLAFVEPGGRVTWGNQEDRKSTRLNSSHGYISYAVFCLKKKNRGVLHLF